MSIRMLRIENREVFKNLDQVLETIHSHFKPNAN
ncbi:hypothetical protein BH24BAC1_BH24BAC1_28510 [soil metagenome]